MVVKNLFCFIICCLSLISCNGLEKKVQGCWVIDQAYYNGEPIIWDLYGNGLGLEKDKKCNLPLITGNNDEGTGTWRVFKKGKVSYLEIKPNNNWIFNRTFEIQNLKLVGNDRTGYLMKMTLVSDSLKLDCTRHVW